MSLEEEDPKNELVLKAVARSRHTYYTKTYDFAAKELSDHARWLTASLLGVNGAASVALLNRVGTPNEDIASLSAFMAGVVFAMLSGYSLQIFYLRAGAPSFNFSEYWLEVAETGEEDSERYQTLLAQLNASQRRSWIPPALGWISGLSFIVGAAILAL